MKAITSVILLVLLTFSALTPALAQDNGDLDPDAMAETFVVAFNNVLRQNLGSRPLARSAILDSVASDIAERAGCIEGSVDFDIPNEAIAAGYVTFPGDFAPRVTRFPLVPMVNIQDIEQIATTYAEVIYETNINHPGRLYREIGIGVVPCKVDAGSRAQGSTQQYVLFTILGSQPDVIPVIIENGGSTIQAADAPVQVELAIYQENTRRVAGIFGAVESIKISNEPITDATDSLDYAPLLSWELESCGENTVYYELTDTNGNTVSGETSVEVVCGG